LERSLDWRRAFAAHLWFGQPRNAPIDRALNAYDKAVMKGFARAPLACSNYKTYKPFKIEVCFFLSLFLFPISLSLSLE
jgi:hypothetical protein